MTKVQNIPLYVDMTLHVLRLRVYHIHGCPILTGYTYMQCGIEFATVPLMIHCIFRMFSVRLADLHGEHLFTEGSSIRLLLGFTSRHPTRLHPFTTLTVILQVGN